MNKSQEIMEKFLESKAKKGEKLDETLLEKMNGPRDVGIFCNEGYDFALCIDNWEYPRCANFVLPTHKTLAKIEIPTSDCKEVKILQGNLTEEQKREAKGLLNSVKHGITCWEAMVAFLEMSKEGDICNV